MSPALTQTAVFVTDTSMHLLHRHLRCWKHVPKTFSRPKSSGSKRNKRYSKTLLLPETEFQTTLRSGVAAAREHLIQETPAFQGLYEWQQQHNTRGTFVLHDGPPYANGKAHVGHALNKILKDITNRYYVLQGRKVHYIPGWDCHGLPIELKALGKDGAKDLTPLEIRDKARKFALNAIEMQKEAFKQWGLMVNWDESYLTLSAEYQARQLDIFFDMFEKGLVYQDFMPVFWSPSSGTALAEAELEYNEHHVSKSVYLRFQIARLPAPVSSIVGPEKKVYAVVWTTTPWTLPANQMISFNSAIQYAVLEEKDKDTVYLCEEAFVNKFSSFFQGSITTKSLVKGTALQSMTYHHPFTQEELPFLNAGHVTSDKGSGLVHTAPSHGHDDFQLAVQKGIPVKSYLDDECRYTSEAGPHLSGLRVDDENTYKTIRRLLGDAVIHEEDFVHSYPYDWRTKKPVIIRASNQWFINTKALAHKAQSCLEYVNVQPRKHLQNMLSQIQSRPYWCISRQRVWGVPIPVFYHKHTGSILLNKSVFSHIRRLVAEHGSDCWWSLSNEELLPSTLLQQLDLGCSQDYVRGKDILDIWFDSGTSWSSVLPDNKQADMYMEGHDQLGAWFQASLFTSVAMRGKAPYRNLVVHGFAMDESGKKMSKSLGNVIDPVRIVQGGKNKQTHPSYGADILRWWVAHSSFHTNVTIGSSRLESFTNSLFQVRKMFGFLLGNLTEFPRLLDYPSLWPQDQYMLLQLYQFGKEVKQMYDDLKYNKVLMAAEKFLNQQVSAFYSNIIKDRCYCGDRDSVGRLSSQTTQLHILETVNKALAPILPHMCEEAFQQIPAQHRPHGAESVFHTGWLNLQPEWNNPEIAHVMQPVFDLRDHILDILMSEDLMEFDVIIFASSLLFSKLQVLQPEMSSSFSPLCEVLQTASVTLTDRPLQEIVPDDVQTVNGICSVHMKDGFSCPERYILVLSASDKYRCERCRRYTAVTQTTPCQRCLDVLAADWS